MDLYPVNMSRFGVCASLPVIDESVDLSPSPAREFAYIAGVIKLLEMAKKNMNALLAFLTVARAQIK